MRRSTLRPSVSTGLVLLALALLLAAGFALERHPSLSKGRSALQKREIEVGENGVRKLHSVLMNDGHLKIKYRRNEDGTVSRTLAWKDEDAGVPAPSTTAVNPEILRDGLTTVSLFTDEVNLYHPETGILEHPKKKGSEWERFGYFSYFVKGELKYEAPVGLRVHGGNSRGWPVKGFAVSFRRGYGVNSSPPGIFFNGTSEPYRRIVLSNTWRERRVGNFVAMEIAEKIGCTVSKTEPVRVLLNGRQIDSTYYLVEHQSRTFLENHFGDGDYLWHRLKGKNRFIPEFEELTKWIKNKKDKKTLEEASEHFDLKDLCAWIMAISFCDTDDSDQGGYFLDRRSGDSRWRSLTWDLDCSFMGRASKRYRIPFSDKPKGLRARLFNSLLHDDPAFRDYYIAFATEALNHRVTPDVLKALVQKYRDIHDRYGETPVNRAWLSRVALILEQRPREYRDLLARDLKSGEWHRCKITGISAPYVVDGYEKHAGYRGFYPSGSVVSVTVPESAGQVSHWLVDDRIHVADGNRFVYKVTAPVIIKPVFVDDTSVPSLEVRAEGQPDNLLIPSHVPPSLNDEEKLSG